MATTPNPPAFPAKATDAGESFTTREQDFVSGHIFTAVQHPGMSLRDWFAGQADVPWNAVIETLEKKFPNRNGKFTVSEVVTYRAEFKYIEADAMLLERAKK